MARRLGKGLPQLASGLVCNQSGVDFESDGPPYIDVPPIVEPEIKEMGPMFLKGSLLWGVAQFEPVLLKVAELSTADYPLQRSYGYR